MSYMYPNEVSVLIGAADAASSDCTEFTTYLSNFSQSGGDQEVESVPLFGGAFIDKENPKSLIEVSFDVVLTYEEALLFDQLVMGSSLDGSTGTDSSQEPVSRVIYIEQSNGTSYYTRAYNNVKAVKFDPEMSADGYMKGSITFKLTAADGVGSPNLKVEADAASTISW